MKDGWELENCKSHCNPSDCRFYDDKECPARLALRMTVKILRHYACSESFKQNLDEAILLH